MCLCVAFVTYCVMMYGVFCVVRFVFVCVIVFKVLGCCVCEFLCGDVSLLILCLCL